MCTRSRPRAADLCGEDFRAAALRAGGLRCGLAAGLRDRDFAGISGSTWVMKSASICQIDLARATEAAHERPSLTPGMTWASNIGNSWNNLGFQPCGVAARRAVM